MNIVKYYTGIWMCLESNYNDLNLRVISLECLVKGIMVKTYDLLIIWGQSNQIWRSRLEVTNMKIDYYSERPIYHLTLGKNESKHPTVNTLMNLSKTLNKLITDLHKT